MKRNKKYIQKQTSYDSLFSLVRSCFDKIEDHRSSNVSHKLGEVLSSSFAMFSLKCPSMLAFEKRSREENHNLHQIFNLTKIPSDTQIRRVLDGVLPEQLRSCFGDLFALLEDLGVTKDYEFYKGKKIISIDGVEHFRSTKVHCDQCICKKHRNGEWSYHHSMLAAVLVHPDKSEVFPLDAEPIVCQDGVEKNDCERNASKRLLASLASRYGEQEYIVVEDALYANGPNIRAIKQIGWNYIINVKPAGNKTIFKQIEGRRQQKQLKQHEFIDEQGNRHVFEFAANLALNNDATDVRTNFVYYEIHPKKGKLRKFSWITDLPLNIKSVVYIMKAARARWKIENETFNTLKNQGYHFEHNYGHGYQNLCSVLAFIMLIAFYVDQIQQYCSTIFQQLKKGLGTRKKLWEAKRGFFKSIEFPTMNHLFIRLANSYFVQLE